MHLLIISILSYHIDNFNQLILIKKQDRLFFINLSCFFYFSSESAPVLHARTHAGSKPIATRVAQPSHFTTFPSLLNLGTS